MDVVNLGIRNLVVITDKNVCEVIWLVYMMVSQYEMCRGNKQSLKTSQTYTIPTANRKTIYEEHTGG